MQQTWTPFAKPAWVSSSLPLRWRSSWRRCLSARQAIALHLHVAARDATPSLFGNECVAQRLPGVRMREKTLRACRNADLLTIELELGEESACTLNRISTSALARYRQEKALLDQRLYVSPGAKNPTTPLAGAQTGEVPEPRLRSAKRFRRRGLRDPDRLWKKKAKLFWTRRLVIAGGMTGEVKTLVDVLKMLRDNVDEEGFTEPARNPGARQRARSPQKGIVAAIYGTKLELAVASELMGENGYFTEDGIDEINQWLITNLPLLSHPNAHFGGWIDPDTNTMEINISLVFGEWEDAYVFGVENDQISTYDLATGVLTPTGGANEQAKEDKLAQRAEKAQRRSNERGGSRPRAIL